MQWDECTTTQCAEESSGRLDQQSGGRGAQPSQAAAEEDRVNCRKDAHQLVHIPALPLLEAPGGRQAVDVVGGSATAGAQGTCGLRKSRGQILSERGEAHPTPHRLQKHRESS